MEKGINKQYIKVLKPDIKILTETFKTALAANEQWVADIKQLGIKESYIGVIQHMQFPCVFDTLCMGDDLDKDGKIRFTRKEFTPGVVTIIRDATSNYFGIFFGTTLSYIMKEPNEVFYSDTKTKIVAKKSEALQRYNPLYICY